MWSALGKYLGTDFSRILGAIQGISSLRLCSGLESFFIHAKSVIMRIIKNSQQEICSWEVVGT